MLTILGVVDTIRRGELSGTNEGNKLIRNHTRASVAIWVMLAVSASAECPTGVDEKNGVVLTRSTPFLSSLYKAAGKGLVEFRVTEKGAVSEQVVATYLHALAPYDRVSAKNTITLQYAESVWPLDDLANLKVWRSAVTVYVDGVPTIEGTATKTFLRTEEVGVGNCHYLAWVVEDRLALGDGDGTYFLQYFAPDLGLIVRSIKMGPNGAPVSGVEFDSIASGKS